MWGLISQVQILKVGSYVGFKPFAPQGEAVGLEVPGLWLHCASGEVDGEAGVPASLTHLDVIFFPIGLWLLPS